MLNKILIWTNIVLFLALILIFFEIERRKVDIYEDPVLQHFGMSRPEIINLYGEPDVKGRIGGPGGEAYFYEQEKIGFIFAGDSSLVNNLEIFPGKDFMGVTIGMTFDEVVRILGVPRQRGFDRYEEDYVMVYNLGEMKNKEGEVEVWFSASADNAPTTRAQIFWKKYWR